MEPNSKVVPLHLHPTGFIEAFVHFGANVNELLRGTGINENMLGCKDVKISYLQQQLLIQQGIKLCNQPGLGLLVGQYIDWTYNGTVGSIVYCSPSLKDAGAAFRRYLTIAQPYYSMYLSEPNFYIDKDGPLTVPIEHFANTNGNPSTLQFEQDYRLAVTTRVWDMCGNKSVDNPEVHVCLTLEKPSHAALYKELPCHSINFGCQQNTITASCEFVMEPWRQFRRSAFNRIIEQCEHEFKDSNVEPTYTEKVLWHINVNILQKELSLDHIAHSLKLSPRALTRKLALEENNFRDIFHAAKMAWTLNHLRSSQLSVEEIANLIGFANPSSLRRAVKNWSGLAVGELRNYDAPTVKLQ